MALDQPWVRAPQPLAHSLSSLGLHVEDGRLALTGLPMARPPSRFEELFAPLRVFGLLSGAGLSRADVVKPERWGTTSWPVEDSEADAAIDPQGFAGGFWYYAAVGTSGDPARHPGAHLIRSSPPAATRYSAEGLADPSPVMFFEHVHFFATVWQEGRESVIHATGDPLVEVQRFPGLSVPFAAVVGDELWLLAQAVVGGRRQPVLSRSADGQRFDAPAAFLDPGALQSCTSPVMGPVSDGWVLFCVEERGGPP